MPADYVVVGGGLQGGLLALALRHRQPAARIVVLERGDGAGGRHTWSFHARDLPAAAEPFVRPLVAASWPGYTVAFPGYGRTVPSPYATILSDRFAAVVAASGAELRARSDVVEVSATHATLANATAVAGRCVIDCRGPAADPPAAAGFQKFVGLEVELARPWPRPLPAVMDATVPQDDGYRFVYTLPLTPTRVLVEETHFSDAPALDRPKLRGRVADYLAALGAGDWSAVREESGVLPMPWAGGAICVNPARPLVAGYAGGWFHPATGYSFPAAVRLALAVAAVPPEQATVAAAALARRLAPRQRFGRFLNRLLFTAVAPAERWQVFRRLYRSLPDALMARFYALEFNPLDAARLVAGWPPPLDLSRLFSRPEVRPCPLSNP